MDAAQTVSSAATAPRGARLLFTSQVVVLSGVLLQTFWTLGLSTQLGYATSRSALVVSNSAWTLIELLELAAIALFTRGRPAGSRGWCATALGCAALDLLAGAVGPVLESHELSPILHQVRSGSMILSALGVEIALWLAVSKTQGRVLGGLDGLYFLLCALGSTASVAFMLGGLTWLRELPLAAVQLVTWARLTVTVARLGTMVWLVWRLAFTFQGSAPAAAPDAPASGSGNDLVVGAIWLGGGLFVTFASYSLASSGGGGGRYLITTGAIAYGLVRLVRGLARANRSVD